MKLKSAMEPSWITLEVHFERNMSANNSYDKFHIWYIGVRNDTEKSSYYLSVHLK